MYHNSIYSQTGTLFDDSQYAEKYGKITKIWKSHNDFWVGFILHNVIETSRPKDSNIFSDCDSITSVNMGKNISIYSQKY